MRPLPAAHPRLLAMAILGAVATVEIHAVRLGSRRRVAKPAADVIRLVLHGIST